MANVINSPIWKLDTTGVVVAAGTMIRLRSVRWVGGVTASDAAILKDSSGRVIYHATATGGNFLDAHFYSGLTVNGLTVDTLASGTIYVEAN